MKVKNVTYFLLLNIFVRRVISHLIFDRPEVWGIENPILLEQPLDETTDPWVCAGNPPRNNGVITLQAGRTYNFSIICGERDLNSPGCLVGDWHAGENVDQYSGCVLSANYIDYANPDEYYYISHSRECGKRGSPSSFTVSRNIQNCTNCVCSWSWAPTRQFSSPGQFYHNCFYCNIVSGAGSKRNMKQQDFINVKGSAYKDTTYNQLLLFGAPTVRTIVTRPTPIPPITPTIITMPTPIPTVRTIVTRPTPIPTVRTIVTRPTTRPTPIPTTPIRKIVAGKACD
jgi:hypothetical protein